MIKKSKSKAVVRILAGVVLATAGSAALAAWNFAGNAAQWSGSGVTTKAVSTDANGVTATATAYYTDQTTFSAGTTFARATLGKNDGGLGVMSGNESTGSPDHSIDNSGNTDMVLLNFSLAIDLNKVLVGWAQTDSDFSVLRYTGTTPLNANSTLNYSGWSIVANVNGSASGNTLTTYDITGANTTTSSWWLISAYNTGFGGTSNGASSGNSNKDYFKLASLEGSYTLPTTTPVPEPASLALVGAALVGLLAVRRRRAGKR